MKHIVVGLVGICLGLWGMIAWFKTFGLVMRGMIPFVLIVFGLVALLAGFRKFATAARSTADEHAFDEDEEEEDGEEGSPDEEEEEAWGSEDEDEGRDEHVEVERKAAS